MNEQVHARLKALARPMTGEEYLESLRDGREVYFMGERVKDVTTHPAFRNTARMFARWYDRLHELHKEDLERPAKEKLRYEKELAKVQEVLGKGEGNIDNLKRHEDF